MSVKIRLARGGSKKRPYFRIVIADIRAPRDGKYIERVGSYNPLLPKDHEDRVKLDLDRIKEWLSKGAIPTDRVARFLDAAGLLKREPRNNPIKAVPKKDPEEEAPAEEAPAEEAPAEETPAKEAKEEAPAEEAPAEEAKEEAPAEEAKEEAPEKEEKPKKKATKKAKSEDK